MNAFQPSKDAEYFQKCLELSPDERDQYLGTLYREDPVRRKRLRNLLKAHKKSGKFLETFPGADKSVQERPDENSGDQIDRYRLLERIGEGSWGTVWKAQQTQDIERHVALKILKLGMDTRDFLARFEAERQMLAMMDHPGIAQVFDAGATDRGRPYFIMELIHGRPLLEYADQERLSLEKRISLFIQVCLAVQHAHAKGFIHRDLKPSNILVAVHDGKPQPKIIDFGIAKAIQFQVTDKAVYTQVNTFLGTPVYSSPEQLGFGGQEVDHRSDVYSLGALLYELLCGKRPFESNELGSMSLEDIRSAIQDKDPVSMAVRYQKLGDEQQGRIVENRRIRASSVESKLRGDLNWIVMKCLEKDRERRYISVEQLLEDLQNYLENKPASAVAPSLAYRFEKFISRQRKTASFWPLVTTAGLALLALLLFLRSTSIISPPPNSPIHSVEDLEKSIAVLPLTNMSPDPENAFFADGVQEDILTNLSKIEGLGLIISRSSTLKYRNPDRNLKQVGIELGVRYLIEGSVRRAGDQVRVTVQLIDSRSDHHLWAETYDRPLDDIFVIQSAVAKEIASELQAVISPEENLQLEYRPTKNQDAYDYWVEFRQLLSATAVNQDQKVELLEKAVALDPEFAEAWFMLSVQYVWWHFRKGGEERLEKARSAFNEGERLDPENIYVYRARSAFEYCENGNLEASIPPLLKALALYPDSVDIHIHKTLGRNYWRIGRFAEAQHHFETVLRLDPLSPQVNRELYSVFEGGKMWERAGELIQTNLKRAEDTEYWQRQLAETDYFINGDRQKYIYALGKFPETPSIMMKRALASRDLETVLELLESGAEARLGRLTWIGGNIIRGMLLNETGEENTLRNLWRQRLEEHQLVGKEDGHYDPSHFYRMAIFSSLLGEREQMIFAISEAREMNLSDIYEYRFRKKTEMCAAMAYLILGDKDMAIEALEVADKMEGPFFLNRELDLWFIFDRLKGNPRFDKLLEG